MTKKTAKHAFSRAFSTGATKYSADATPVELVALPVLPASPFQTGVTDARSGIEFSYDAGQLIAGFNARGRKLPLDIEHNTELGGEDTRARGWIHALTNATLEPTAGFESGVLYAWVELTSLGFNELGDKNWGYTSAVVLGAWLTEANSQITRIKSLALTNNPATEMPMNFTESDAAEEAANAGYTHCEQLTPEQIAMLSQLLEKLGLTTETPEADVLARVDALLAPSEVETALTTLGVTAVDVTAGSLVRLDALTAATEQVTSLTAQVSTMQTELTAAATARTVAETALTAFQAEQTASAVVAAVDGALADAKFKPATRDSLISLATKDLAAFNVLAGSIAKNAMLTPVATRSTTADETFGLTAEQLEICSSNGIKPELLAKNLRKNATA